MKLCRWCKYMERLPLHTQLRNPLRRVSCLPVCFANQLSCNTYTSRSYHKKKLNTVTVTLRFAPNLRSTATRREFVATRGDAARTLKGTWRNTCWRKQQGAHTIPWFPQNILQARYRQNLINVPADVEQDKICQMNDKYIRYMYTFEMRRTRKNTREQVTKDCRMLNSRLQVQRQRFRLFSQCMLRFRVDLDPALACKSIIIVAFLQESGKKLACATCVSANSLQLNGVAIVVYEFI